MPAKADVQFKLNLPGGELVFPTKPVTIPADEFFIWPFNLDLGGAKLIYATAQPVCKTDDGNVQTFFFAETPGMKADFVFDPKTLTTSSAVFENIKPGGGVAIQVGTKSGKQVQIVLSPEWISLKLRKDPDNTNLVLVANQPQESNTVVQTTLLQPAGPAREIPLSTGKSRIAIAPDDADFTNAAIWKIMLPAKLDLSSNPILRIHYVGDVARLTLNGRLIDDNFYAGRTFDLGLNRYAPEILTGDLRLEILPLRKDAPIFLEPKAKPDFGSHESIATLQNVEIINSHEVEFTPAAP